MKCCCQSRDINKLTLVVVRFQSTGHCSSSFYTVVARCGGHVFIQLRLDNGDVLHWSHCHDIYFASRCNGNNRYLYLDDGRQCRCSKRRHVNTIGGCFHFKRRFMRCFNAKYFCNTGTFLRRIAPKIKCIDITSTQRRRWSFTSTRDCTVCYCKWSRNYFYWHVIQRINVVCSTSRGNFSCRNRSSFWHRISR